MRIFVLLMIWLIMIVLLSYFCFITKYSDVNNTKSIDIITNSDVNSTDNSTINSISPVSTILEERNKLTANITIDVLETEKNNLTEEIENVEDIELTATPTPIETKSVEPKEDGQEEKNREEENNLTITSSSPTSNESNQTRETSIDKSLLCEDIFNSVLSKDKIFFDKNKFNIKKNSYALLDELIKVSKECPESTIVIEGYTDSIGSKSGNRRISQKRADAVKKYLIKGGISKDRLTAVGYGEIKPIATNSTPEGREKNRRIEIHIEGVKSE